MDRPSDLDPRCRGVQLVRIARPFINPNHYSASVAMGALVAIGLALALLAGTTGRLDRLGIRAALLDRDWTLPRVIAAGVLACLGGGGRRRSRTRAAGCSPSPAASRSSLAARWIKGWIAVAVVAVVLVGLLAGLPAMPAANRLAFATPALAASGWTRRR